MMEAAQFRRELTGNILPFWMRHTVDREDGGFYGAVTCDLKVVKEAPRAAVINARILWTFSAAYRLLGNPEYREMADRAYAYILDKFWDKEYGGVYWMVDYRGHPISERKQIYAQAFAIYGLSEYYRATGKTESLERAQQLFRLIEEKSREAVYGGYLEACSRDWGALDDLRLSEKDLNSPKSMNTHLHVMEAYTNLLRVWRDPSLVAAQKALLEVTLDHIVDGASGHFRMFFDNQWNSLTDHISFGHDIEGSWLLCEAAEALGDAALFERVRGLALRMAGVALSEGLDAAGGLCYEGKDGKIVDGGGEWWPQSEAVVGFLNAFQLSGDPRFLHAAHRVWDFIESRLVDRAHGEWFWRINPDGRPAADLPKVSEWKGPYHGGRACLEAMRRLGQIKSTPT